MTDIFVAPKKTANSTQVVKVLRRESSSLENNVLKNEEALIEKDPVILAENVSKRNKSYSPKKNVGIFSSFRVRPSGISFEEQGEDEEIFLFLRRHIVTNVPWILGGIILLLLPIFLSLLSYTLPITIPSNFMLILVLFYYLIVITFIFTSYSNWFFNTCLVTDKRIVDIDYSDIIYHDMAVTKLNLIEDIDYVQTGFISSFFNYGNIFIQTAGAKQIFDFIAVPRPARATEIIQNLMGGDKDVWD